MILPTVYSLNINPPVIHSHNEITGHDGVFLVREKDIERYLKEYSPTQLRYSRTKKVNPNYEVMNFGESKGTTRDRVLISPTQKKSDWLFNGKKLISAPSAPPLHQFLLLSQFN